MTKIRFYSVAMTFFALCMVAFTSKTMAQSFNVSYKGNTFTCTPVSHPELGTNLVTVTAQSGSGVCEIPATVTNGGTTYTVIGTTNSAPFSNSFTEMIIPNTVVYIGQQSFASTSVNSTALQKITFGGSVQYIGIGAFIFCTNLQEMIFKGNSPPYLVDYYQNLSHPGRLADLRYAFGEQITGVWVKMVPANCTIKVPCGSFSAYQNDIVCNGTVNKFGSYFTDIVEYGCINTVSVTVTEPVVGANPTNATTTTANTTIFLTEWKRVSDDYIMQPTDQFVTGQTYRCGIIIYPTEDYGFPTDATVTINDTAADIYMQATNYINCYREFTLSPITTASVTVTAPIGGANPVFTATVASSDVDKYTAAVNEWYDIVNDIEMTPADVFVEGQDYKLAVVLTPKSGYEFSATPTLTINGISAQFGFISGGEVYFYLELTAINENERIITATAGANGTISPSGTVIVEKGSDRIFTFSANSGYQIDEVKIDGANNAAAVTAGSYTFENVTENHTINVTFKTTTGIFEVLANSISIYPNPTKGEIRIESGELRVEKVEILDITGRTVLTSHETTLNISQLSAGTYFVKLKTDKGILTKKVIKE